ncbi:MAG: hypothetical protein ACFFDT_24615, partial [Candidatus Hodarchaeota archaeon]
MQSVNITKFQINEGDNFTASYNVSLILETSNNTSLEYRLRNDGENWTDWTNFSGNITIPWSLRDEEGLRTVEVEVRDQGDHVEYRSDTITLDYENPIINQFVINNDNLFTDSRNVTLTLNASDTTSSTEYRLRNDGESWTGWVGFSGNITIPWTLYDEDGLRTVEVEVRDQLNHSIFVSDTIYLYQGPSIYVIVSINNGALSTDSTNVSLTLINVKGNLTQMRFSNGNETFTVWEEFNNTKDWDSAHIIIIPGKDAGTTHFGDVDKLSNGFKSEHEIAASLFDGNLL